MSRSVREPLMVLGDFLGMSESVPDEIEVWPVARLSTEAFVLAGLDDMEDLLVAVVGVEPD